MKCYRCGCEVVSQDSALAAAQYMGFVRLVALIPGGKDRCLRPRQPADGDPGCEGSRDLLERYEERLAAEAAANRLAGRILGFEPDASNAAAPMDDAQIRDLATKLALKALDQGDPSAGKAS